jgi:predicted histone-like DNA-binding protein
MAILYKLYQDNRRNSLNNGKFYARAIHPSTIDTKGLAEIMQRNCTVKYSDILAVLAELSETMKTMLQSSMRVKLDGIGSFKIGLRTVAADTAKDFDANKNVKSMHVNFMPEMTVSPDHKRHFGMLEGAKAQETAFNDNEAANPKAKA